MSDLRTCIRECAKAYGFDEETVQHLVLAVDEAATNIIRYAYEGKTDGKIEVDVVAGSDSWEVRLRDYGKKCDPAKMRGRDLEDVRPGGLGLYFIHQAFDEVHFDHSYPDGTLLILKKSKAAKK
jgi:anti-sigma regulatory factor (Ser/Thr protein kinase)